MKQNLKEKLMLYAVSANDTDMGQIISALEGGITCFQLRYKNTDPEKLLPLAEQIADICKTYGVPFIVNDNVHLAKYCGADGVHLGQSDMDPKQARQILGDNAIIGVTVKNVHQAQIACQDGADYLGCGAAFSTLTKSDTSLIDHQIYRDITSAVDIPVVAIGGIDDQNALSLSGYGLAGLAVSGGIFGADDICAAAHRLCRKAKAIVSPPSALTIAGSDSSGGAGIQADIKTMLANGVYASSAITAMTAQNTKGVYQIQMSTPEFLAAQIDSVFEDIFPMAVKTGMLGNGALTQVVCDRLKYHGAQNIVVDPVMVATSGARLMEDQNFTALTTLLLPMAKVVTPNIPEAQALTGLAINTRADMEIAAKAIYDRYGCAALVKGGHSIQDASDVLYDGCFTWFEGKRIDCQNTHGTGCTLSSAIASNLAKGYNLVMAIELAKQYISGALQNDMNLGFGSGPLNHGWRIR